MTGRDLAWRGAGALAIAGACLVGAIEADGGGAVALLGLAAFVTALAGVVLLIQGDRFPRALRIERSRHRELPTAIGQRRRARRDA